MGTQIYADCNLCGKWDDLMSWHKIAHLCIECADKLEKNAHHFRSKFKISNREVFRLAQQGDIEWQNTHTE